VSECSVSDRRAVAELSLMPRCSVAVMSLLSPLFFAVPRCYSAVVVAGQPGEIQVFSTK